MLLWCGWIENRRPAGPVNGPSQWVYLVAPRRLQPGFEKQLSRPSMLLVYASFGLALGTTHYLLSRGVQPRTRARAHHWHGAR